MENRPDVNPAARKSVLTYRSTPVVRAEHAEGSLTRLLEQQTAKIPSHWFLFAALCSMAFSAGMELADRRRAGRFVGMWAAPLLVMGVYNKLVKVLGFR